MSGTGGARDPDGLEPEGAAPTAGEHVRAEVLADVAEGLLPPAQAARVDAHLAGCRACRADLDALSGVTAVLREHADPGPMPDLVARRLERALAAAGAVEPTAADAGSRPLAEPEPPPAARRGRGRDRQATARARWARVAVGWVTAAACLAAVVVGVNALQGLQGGGTGASTAGGAAAEAEQGTSGTDSRAGAVAPDAAQPDTSGGRGGGAGGVPSASAEASRDGTTTRAAAPLQALSARGEAIAGDPAAATLLRTSAAAAAAPTQSQRPVAVGTACSLQRVDAVPGRVVRIEPLDLPSGTAYAVALTRPDGGGTAVAIDRCAADAPPLVRADTP